MAEGIVVGSPGFDDPPGCGPAQKDMLVEAFVTQAADPRLSANAFCMGLPGAMKYQPRHVPAISTAYEVSSGPLSLTTSHSGPRS